MNSPRSTYLAARTSLLDIGIDAECIRRVVPLEEWDGPAPIDLDQLVQEPASNRAMVTVLVLDGDEGPYAVCSGHPLVVRELAPARLHELPSVLWQRAPSRAFLRIAREPGAPPLLILNHRALSRERASQPSPTPPSSGRCSGSASIPPFL